MESLGRLLAKGIIYFICILVVAFFVEPSVRFLTPLAAIYVTILLSVSNAFIKPIVKLILKIFTFPINASTMGAWSIVLNFIVTVGMVYLISAFVEGFLVKGVFAIFIFSVASSFLFIIILWVFENFLGLSEE